MEHIAIVGSGITGLACALALGRTQRFRVTLIERDEAPESQHPDEAFASWQRPGVPHLRHSHVFLARLYLLIRDEYPDLLEQLLDAGCRELKFADGLPSPLRPGYRPTPEDLDMTILSSRRTTLELVMRNYVVQRGEVEYLSGARVRQALIDSSGPIPRVHGLRVQAHDEADLARDLRFDVVIDAAGKRSPFAGWLRQAGIEIEEESAAAGILYLTRHYRLRPGQTEPERGDLPGNGDLGYFKFGVFPADRGNFSVTVALPEEEEDLRRAVKRPMGFDLACQQCPGVARWIAPERSEPCSKVYGMGDLESHWKSFVVGGEPVVLGYFAAGDAVIRTNPLYGRGCSSGALQAHLLAEVLTSEVDPGERLRRYCALQEREIRPHYESMAKQDQQAIRRGAQKRDPHFRPTLKQRVMRSFVEDGLVLASRGDLTVLRALMRSFHMLEDPGIALKEPGILLRILRFWLRPSFAKRHLRLPRIGPSRDEMLALLGIEQITERSA